MLLNKSTIIILSLSIILIITHLYYKNLVKSLQFDIAEIERTNEIYQHFNKLAKDKAIENRKELYYELNKTFSSECAFNCTEQL